MNTEGGVGSVEAEGRRDISVWEGVGELSRGDMKAGSRPDPALPPSQQGDIRLVTYLLQHK